MQDDSEEAIEGICKRSDRHTFSAAACLGMGISKVLSIISAERLNHGIVIRFSDGRCGFYKTSYLHSKLEECEELNEADVEW